METNTNFNIQQYLPKQLQRDDEKLFISKEGEQLLGKVYDPKDPLKHFLWTDDIHLELPIIMKKIGMGSLQPKTLIDSFNEIMELMADMPSLSQKGPGGKWFTRTYRQVYEDARTFGRALIASGVESQSAVNIIGMNSIEWFVTFYGSVFARDFPVGVYTTNQVESCQYILENSECQLVVCEGLENLLKYIKISHNLGQGDKQQQKKRLLLKIVVYGVDAQQLSTFLQQNPVAPSSGTQIQLWQDFMQLGNITNTAQNRCELDQQLTERMKTVRPGHCCTVVYTSGTTGAAKGVMLSHDNYVWTAQVIVKHFKIQEPGKQGRVLSFLPLSHSLAQMTDIFGNIVQGLHIFIADASALKGALVDFLKEVRPTFFVAVPRVFEKMQEGIVKQAQKNKNGFIKQQIINWAKNKGLEGTFAESRKLPVVAGSISNSSSNQNAKTSSNKDVKLPAFWGFAKKNIYSKVKDALGLDQAFSVVFGGAPLSMAIRKFFINLNINLLNGYGMSESAGPESAQMAQNYDAFDDNYFLSAGQPIQGTTMGILDEKGNELPLMKEGEICYRGRNRFMGYFKLEAETRKTIDQQGFLHTGDLGFLDQRGNLRITGRIKELIITAGGENVAPILIENVLREEIGQILGSCMVIGEKKHYLTAILSLRHDLDAQGKPAAQLAPETLQKLKEIGSTAKNVEQAKQCKVLRQFIDQAIKKANTKAVSKANAVQKWALLDREFSIDGGELTPTLKLKRNAVIKKYQAVIDTLYNDAKL